MHSDAIRRGGRYLIVDDVIATGGTAAAVANVVAQQGASVEACLFLIELKFLAGREKLGDVPVVCLITY
jgi:adenine phosphoribosyltransferase